MNTPITRINDLHKVSKTYGLVTSKEKIYVCDSCGELIDKVIVLQDEECKSIYKKKWVCLACIQRYFYQDTEIVW